MILLLDNYDSFVHNLARYLGELGEARQVVRSDAISVDGIRALAPAAIVLSPGPCTPDQAGICLDVVHHLGPTTPILGVCLGHQCIGQVYGGRVVRAPRPVHGRASPIRHDGRDLFAGLPDGFAAARYHSLVVELAPDAPLAVTARTDDGLIMGLAHRIHPVWGVQFHPESVLTEHGHALLANFLALARGPRAATLATCALSESTS